MKSVEEIRDVIWGLFKYKSTMEFAAYNQGFVSGYCKALQNLNIISEKTYFELVKFVDKKALWASSKD